MDLDALDALAEKVIYESSHSSAASSSSDSSIAPIPAPKRARLTPDLPIESDSEFEELDFTDLFAAHDVLAKNHARGLANLIAHLETEAQAEEGDDIDLLRNVVVKNNGHLKQRADFNTMNVLQSLVSDSEDSSDEFSNHSLVDEVDLAEAHRDGTAPKLPSRTLDRGHTDLEVTGMELVRAMAGRRSVFLDDLIAMSQ